MTVVPTAWIVIASACFIVMTLMGVALLAGLLFAMTRAKALMDVVSEVGVPRMVLLVDHATAIAQHLEVLAARVDSESQSALPRVEHVLGRVDRATELMERGSERVHGVVEGTAEGLSRVRHSPLTRNVLIGAGAVAAARTVRNALDRYRERPGAAREGNGGS